MSVRVLEGSMLFLLKRLWGKLDNCSGCMAVGTYGELP